MPTTTTRRAVTRKPATKPPSIRPTVSPLRERPAPEPVADEREFWVLHIAPQWKDFTGPEYFYDGEIHVEKGVARVPAHRTDWVQRLLFNNYAFTSERDEQDFNATIR